jgi:CRP-like cAMP-binding protein
METQWPERSTGRREMPAASQFASSCFWNLHLLTPEERDVLARVASPAKSIKAGVDLIQEGQQSDSLLLIIDGWACRYTTTLEGTRLLTALLVPGDLGNLGTLMFERLDYSVRTLSDASIVALPRDKALALGAEHPGIANMFTWLALVDNAILSKWALSLGRRPAKQRLAHLLCELSVRLHAEDGNQSSFALPVTQEQLGDALGLTAVHVNRMLQQLRDDALVVTANRAVTLPDVARLRRLAGFDPAYLHHQVPARFG